MADNKQYLNQKLEKGTLLISEDVLETIVINALNEVESVAGLSNRPALDIVEVIGKKNIGKSLKITIGRENELRVDCNINIFYGQNILDAANAAQTAITVALESAAKATVSAVNVSVCGIIRK